jgi:putative transposase
MLAADSPLCDKLTVRERPGKTCFRFWQEGAGYDRNLTSPSAIEASLDYIHSNPVKRRLCERAIDWKWSSARWYLGEPPRQPEPGLPRIAGIPDGLFR